MLAVSAELLLKCWGGGITFHVFCLCDPDLDPMTFIYELYLYALEIYQMCEYELFMSGLSKVIV